MFSAGFPGGRVVLRYFSLKIQRNLPTWWRTSSEATPVGQTQHQRAKAILLRPPAKPQPRL